MARAGRTPVTPLMVLGVVITAAALCTAAVMFGTVLGYLAPLPAGRRYY